MDAQDRAPGRRPGRPSPFRLERALAGLGEAPSGPEAGRLLAEARAEGEGFLARYPTWKALEAAQGTVSVDTADAAPDGPAQAPAPEAPAGASSGAARPAPAASAHAAPRRALPFRPRAWLALAAGLALGLFSLRLVLAPAPEVPDLAAKGGPSFSILVAGRPGAAGRDIPAAPGDTVQLFLHHDRPLHHAVFYRDDGGPWELYFASGGPAPASPRGEPLAHSIVLDSGWRAEDIAALASEAPPGAAGRDCLPPPGPAGAAPAPAPAHCRDIALSLFRLRRIP